MLWGQIQKRVWNMIWVRAASLSQVRELPGDFCKTYNICSDVEILVCLKKKEKAITASSHIHILLVTLIEIFGLGTNISG